MELNTYTRINEKIIKMYLKLHTVYMYIVLYCILN